MEDYDRKYSPWRGPITTIDKKFLKNDKWREILIKENLPRDIDEWKLAVVTEINKSAAMIGIEGFSTNENQFLDFNDELEWAQNREFSDGNRISIRNIKDMWSVGDVIYVKPMYTFDGTIYRWTLRQIPKIQGGFVAMDTETGRVLAMQGGFSYQHSVFNRATQARRQPGSSFKPFVYAAALDVGYSPAAMIMDEKFEIMTPQGLWSPKNYSGEEYGLTPLRVGIERSRNLMTVRLAQDVGMDVVAGYAERFGVYNRMPTLLAAAFIAWSNNSRS